MTVAAGTRISVAAPGHRRLVLVLLVLSAALNIFFVGGAVWFRLHAPAELQGREQRYHRMAVELQLNDQQRAGFDRYVAAMRNQTERVREQVTPLYTAAWQELAKPQADAGEVMRLFDAAAEKRREFQREALPETLAFMAVLSPEQRQKFITIARPQPRSWLRRQLDRR